MTLAKVFGQVLQESRSEKGLSQEQLAQLSDLDRTYISLLERGLRQPSLKTIFDLAKNLNKPPSHLIEIVESRYENKS